jgi:MFS family permease
MAVTTTARVTRTRWRLAWLAWGLWMLTMLGLVCFLWLDQLLDQAGRAELTWLLAGVVPMAVAAVSAATVGAVLASRRPRHPVGWLLLGLGLSLIGTPLTAMYARYGVMAQPGALPAAGYLAGFSNSTIVVAFSCAAFVLLLTPSGSLPSPRWRWWARVAAAATVLLPLALALDAHPLYPLDKTFTNPLFVAALGGLLSVVQAAGAVIVLAGLVVAAGSLIVRFRRARGVEHQQLRWLAFAAAVAVVALLVAAAAAALGNDRVILAPTGVAMAVLPLAVGAAILRYRLYDLDRIISRTLAYGLLTLLLGLGYAGVVLGLGRLLPQGSSLVVAAATLVVAAVFQPARRRIQQAVDRRFNRRRYNAGRTIEAFGARLRQQVDLDTLTGELLAVVDETMQPTQASMWLRPAPDSPSPRGGASGLTLLAQP